MARSKTPLRQKSPHSDSRCGAAGRPLKDELEPGLEREGRSESPKKERVNKEKRIQPVLSKQIKLVKSPTTDTRTTRIDMNGADKTIVRKSESLNKKGGLYKKKNSKRGISLH